MKAPSRSRVPSEVPTMAYEGSITRCLGMLRAGDREAAQALWDRYFQRLV
jgi:hypothetical protein